jgi:hypothetical protein
LGSSQRQGPSLVIFFVVSYSGAIIWRISIAGSMLGRYDVSPTPYASNVVLTLLFFARSTHTLLFQVEWSPFDAKRLLVSSAQHFGLVGNGRVHIVDFDESRGALIGVRHYDTLYGVLECCWSEENEVYIGIYDCMICS